jgi:hypothetical protein
MKRKVIGIILGVGVFAALAGVLACGIIRGDALICVLTAIPIGMFACRFIRRGYHEGACNADEALNIAAALFGIPSGILFVLCILQYPQLSGDDQITMVCLGMLLLAITVYLIWAYALRPLIFGCIGCLNDSWFVKNPPWMDKNDR